MTETNTNLQNTISALQAKFETVQQDPTQSALQQLEEQVSDLVTQAVGTPHAGAVESLLTQITELRLQVGTTTASITEGKESDSIWQAQFEKARGYILFGTIAEQRQGLQDLQSLLAQRPSDETLLDLLKSAVERDNKLREPIVDLIEHVSGPAAAALRQQLQMQPDSSPSSTPEQPYADLEQRIIDLYYEGEYRKVLKLCIDLLRQVPENDVALEYKRKCEQNISGGVVPDARLPMMARHNYNRGFSALRGGDYKEAKDRFEAALDEARAVGILEWSAVEEALQGAEDGLEAQKLLLKAREARAADQWEEAIDLYQRARNVFPESVSDETIKILRNQAESYLEIRQQLAYLGSNIVIQATTLCQLDQRLRTLFPAQLNSSKLKDLAQVITQEKQARASALINYTKELAQKARFQKNPLLVRQDLEQAVDLIACFSTADKNLAPPDEVRETEQFLDRLANFMEEINNRLASNTPDELLVAVDRLMHYGRSLYPSIAYQDSLNDTYIELLTHASRTRAQGDFAWAQRLLDSCRDLLANSRTLSLRHNENETNSWIEPRVRDEQIALLQTQARYFHKDGKYEQAYQFAQEARSLQPDNAQLDILCQEIEKSQTSHRRLNELINEGEIALLAHQWETAVEALRQAKIYAPKETRVDELLTEAIRMMRLHDEGFNALSRQGKVSLIVQGLLATIFTIALISLLLLLLS